MEVLREADSTAHVSERHFTSYLIERRILSPAQLEEAIRLQHQPHLLLGELCIQHGYLKSDGVARILEAQQTSTAKFGELAVSMGLISPEQLQELLTAQASNHFYLGEALVALGHFRSKEELFQHLTDFKALASPSQLDANLTLWPEFDQQIVEKILELTYEFFYSKGFVVQVAEISPTLPPPGDYQIYCVTHTLRHKGLFRKKTYYTLSILLSKAWNNIISRDGLFGESESDSSEKVAEFIHGFNSLLCKRLNKLDYRCKHGPVRSTLPASRHRLTIRFSSSIEPLYLLCTDVT